MHKRTSDAYSVLNFNVLQVMIKRLPLFYCLPTYSRCGNHCFRRYESVGPGIIIPVRIDVREKNIFIKYYESIVFIQTEINH
jgi:hypothetical protein